MNRRQLRDWWLALLRDLEENRPIDADRASKAVTMAGHWQT